ncbi:ankyrin repeat-containing protein [Anaeramoeba ignava]|uniref:Ankyrin repeat-containing protein n=1 Tax=Anaeramoeba ignava TaxID=1746090 RepID=A0A9Q0LF60_ANAIG|nr:ankyrin repeat-containing protein [Anaeramoeba ignava]
MSNKKLEKLKKMKKEDAQTYFQKKIFDLDIEQLQILIEKEVDINQHHNKTALHFFCETAETFDLAEYLASQPNIRIDEVDSGFTSLHYACQHNLSETAKMLCSKGADFNKEIEEVISENPRQIQKKKPEDLFSDPKKQNPFLEFIYSKKTPKPQTPPKTPPQTPPGPSPNTSDDENIIEPIEIKPIEIKEIEIEPMEFENITEIHFSQEIDLPNFFTVFQQIHSKLLQFQKNPTPVDSFNQQIAHLKGLFEKCVQIFQRINQESKNGNFSKIKKKEEELFDSLFMGFFAIEKIEKEIQKK